ncbi:proteoglycan 4-like [Colletes gigas]|uniref:proteoglycan 4-like n=1 Tax=Colletes gigas TaxID=935657 RepID=UPI001C9B33ED|nr:proteoglycan 4-like [Colletes gigas]
MADQRTSAEGFTLPRPKNTVKEAAIAATTAAIAPPPVATRNRFGALADIFAAEDPNPSCSTTIAASTTKPPSAQVSAPPPNQTNSTQGKPPPIFIHSTIVNHSGLCKLLEDTAKDKFEVKYLKTQTNKEPEKQEISRTRPNYSTPTQKPTQPNDHPAFLHPQPSRQNPRENHPDAYTNPPLRKQLPNPRTIWLPSQTLHNPPSSQTAGRHCARSEQEQIGGSSPTRPPESLRHCLAQWTPAKTTAHQPPQTPNQDIPKFPTQQINDYIPQWHKIRTQTSTHRSPARGPRPQVLQLKQEKQQNQTREDSTLGLLEAPASEVPNHFGPRPKRQHQEVPSRIKLATGPNKTKHLHRQAARWEGEPYAPITVRRRATSLSDSSRATPISTAATTSTNMDTSKPTTSTYSNISADGFILHRTKRTSKEASADDSGAPTRPATQPTPISNRFAALADIFDISNDANSQPSPKEQVTPPNDPTPSAAQGKPPPIFIHTHIKDHNGLCDLIKSTIDNKFEVKYLSNQAKVTLATTPDFLATKNLLTDSNIQYHTYSLTAEKTIAVVLKGLPKLPTDEILAEIQAKDLNALCCSELKRKIPSYLATYKVIFAKGTTLQQINHVRNVAHTRAYWEKYNSSRPYIQCYRCQAFGHSSSNCTKAHNCLKCAGKHSTQECTKPPTTPATCCNCGGSHPANYSQCPSLLAFLKKRSTAQNPPPQVSKTSPTSNPTPCSVPPPITLTPPQQSLPTVTPRKTYASITAQNRQTTQPDLSSLFAKAQAINEILDINSMAAALDFLYTKLSTCNTKVQKLQAFLEATELING